MHSSGIYIAGYIYVAFLSFVTLCVVTRLVSMAINRNKRKIRVLRARCRKHPQNFSFMHGERIYTHKHELLLNRIPKIDEVKFVEIDNYYFGEVDGFLFLYHHRPRSTDGFAGAVFNLKMEDGTERVFQGSLWDPFTIPLFVPEFVHVHVTDDPEVMVRNHTFCAAKITKKLYDKLNWEGMDGHE